MQATNASCATLFADKLRLHAAGRLAEEAKAEGVEVVAINGQPPSAVTADAEYMDAEEDNLYADNVALNAASSTVRSKAQKHALINLDYDACLAYVAKDGSLTVRSDSYTCTYRLRGSTDPSCPLYADDLLTKGHH